MAWLHGSYGFVVSECDNGASAEVLLYLAWRRLRTIMHSNVFIEGLLGFARLHALSGC